VTGHLRQALLQGSQTRWSQALDHGVVGHLNRQKGANELPTHAPPQSLIAVHADQHTDQQAEPEVSGKDGDGATATPSVGWMGLRRGNRNGLPKQAF